MVGKYDTGCPAGERPWDMCKDSTGVYWGMGWGGKESVYNNVKNAGSAIRKELAAAGSCSKVPRYNPDTSEGKKCSWAGTAKDQIESTWSPP